MKTSSPSNSPGSKCALKMKPHSSEFISFNNILDRQEQLSPKMAMPNFTDIIPENHSKIISNAIIKSIDNPNQANYTIYESQYEMLVSQTRMKKRESNLEIDNSKRIEETSKTPVKLAGPCFLNMIDPFQINRRQMKLLTHRLNNNEFQDLQEKVKSFNHVS